MDQIGYEVEGVLKDILPDRFRPAFDGWDNGNNTNYCGLFVMWYDVKKSVTVSTFYGWHHYSDPMTTVQTLTSRRWPAFLHGLVKP